MAGDASNKESSNIRLIRAVICAGLYPNVVRIQNPETTYIEQAAGCVLSTEEFLVWFLGFLVSWFLGFLVSWFLGLWCSVVGVCGYTGCGRASYARAVRRAVLGYAPMTHRSVLRYACVLCCAVLRYAYCAAVRSRRRRRPGSSSFLLNPTGMSYAMSGTEIA
eukprot:1924902-Rhodomonas_salina.2